MFSRPLLALAWFNVIVHALGLALAVFGMRPGTPAVALEQRLDYLAASPLGWTLGWVTWMVCAGSLIAFLTLVVDRLQSPASVARLGLVIAVVGCGFDLFCDSAYIVVLPTLAATRTSPALFLAFERLIGLGSLVVANGSYALGILLISIALRGQRPRNTLTFAVGLGVAGFGFLLSAAGFTGVAAHAEYATGPTIGLFCVWTILVARNLERPT